MFSIRNNALPTNYQKSVELKAKVPKASNFNIKENQAYGELLFESLSKILIIIFGLAATLYFWNYMPNLYYKGFLVFIILIYTYAFLKFVSKKTAQFQKINKVIETQILMKGAHIYKTILMWLF